MVVKRPHTHSASLHLDVALGNMHRCDFELENVMTKIFRRAARSSAQIQPLPQHFLRILSTTYYYYPALGFSAYDWRGVCRLRSSLGDLSLAVSLSPVSGGRWLKYQAIRVYSESRSHERQ